MAAYPMMRSSRLAALTDVLGRIVFLRFEPRWSADDTREDRLVIRYAMRIATPLWSLACVGFLAIMAFGIRNWSSPSRWITSVATLLALAIASALLGGLLGFLFGIPRTRGQGNGSGTPPATKESGASTQETFTHLEEISDWLAKILVGVGLAQLTGMPTRLWNIAGILARHLSDADPAPPQAFILFVMVAYFVLGLMGSFLFTRLFLRRIYQAADSLSAVEIRNVDDFLQMDRVSIDTLLSEKASPTTTLPADVSGSVQRLAAIPLESLHTQAALRAWAKAQLLTRHYGKAVQGYERAVSLAPQDDKLQSELAMVRTLAARVWRQESISEAEKVKESADERAQVSATETLMFNALYEGPPAGFTKVIELGEKLVQESKASGTALAYLVAAHGQKTKWAATGRDEAASKDARARALTLTRLVLEAKDQGGRDLLRYLWTTTEPTEDDLQVFRGDADFEALLGKL